MDAQEEDIDQSDCETDRVVHRIKDNKQYVLVFVLLILCVLIGSPIPVLVSIVDTSRVYCCSALSTEHLSCRCVDQIGLQIWLI